jgi:hypothetical protein
MGVDILGMTCTAKIIILHKEQTYFACAWKRKYLEDIILKTRSRN